MGNRLSEPMTVGWVMSLPIDVACSMVADAYKTDEHSVDGSVLACLVQRLVNAEARPGGPYKNQDGTVDFITNLSVGYLFAVLGKPLPRVASFITKNRGSSSPKTALLLQQYDLLTAPQDQPTVQPLSSPPYQKAKTTLSLLGDPLKEEALGFLSRVQRADINSEISQISAYFEHSLIIPSHAPPLLLLGEANIYCWIAYMTYDHIIDGEPSAHQLPGANVAMRLSLSRYQSLYPSGHPFQKVITQTFDTMDLANAWEVRHCRFNVKDGRIAISSLPDYGQYSLLAKRSFAHVLGPLALTYLGSYTALQYKKIHNGFHHYLIARQLNDDMHDWQEDIRAGHINAVVAHILKNIRVDSSSYNLDELILRMRADFWQRSMAELNQIIRKHVDLSLGQFKKSRMIKDESELLALISRQHQITIESDHEHQRYENFSKTYRHYR